MGLLVVNPGPCATVQDEGRGGQREWGVPVGGACDRGSAALANALLGNPPGCAVVELTLNGGRYQAQTPLAIALAGAPLDAAIVDRDGSSRPLVLPLSATMEPGTSLVLGGMARGARTYLAVRGGWQTPIILGSRSCETRLKSGDIIPAEPGRTPVRHLAGPVWDDPAAVPLRIVAGPDQGPELLDWEHFTFLVSRQADRMGLRLDGPPLPVRVDPERPSAPVAPGAVQVAGGQAIVLGVACGTMGGYPHVAHVITADLDRIGQLRSGDGVRFQPVTIAEARRIDRQTRAAQARRLLRVAVAASDALSGF